MNGPIHPPAAASIQKSTSDLSMIRVPAFLRLTFLAAARLSPHLGAAIAQEIFFRPMHAPYREEHKAVLATARKASLDVRGKRVQAYFWGEGPSVLLMHGWGGHAGQMTEFVAPLVKAGYEVLAIDAPAHGRSAGRLPTIVHFADAIEAANAAFGPLDSVHSMAAAPTTIALSRGGACGVPCMSRLRPALTPSGR
jgi:alpha-beta hydrolase superfamily lysophospholipase